MKRRSSLGVGGLRLTSSRQEKLAGRPASASSIGWANMVRGRTMSSRVNFWAVMPLREKASAWISPRHEGSATSTWRSGWDCDRLPIFSTTSSAGRNKRPLRLKNGFSPSSWTVGNSLGSARSFSARALLAAVARSEGGGKKKQEKNFFFFSRIIHEK